MISGWLVKVVLGIFLAGFLVFEVGSPLIARAQADEAAHEVANAAALRLRDTFTQAALETTCREKAEEESVELQRCEIDGQRRVAVTVTKEAPTIVLGKIDALGDWYRAEASATATLHR